MKGHSLRRACLIIIIHTKRMLPGVAGGGAFTAATHAEQRCSVLRCLMHAMVPWSSAAVSCVASCMPWCHGAALQCLALPHACHGAMEQHCSVLHCLMHAMVPWSSAAMSCVASCMPWCHGAALQCLALPHACHGAMEQRSCGFSQWR